ncbi:AP-5 complex subunit mu-1 [Ixodes scapularis]|uniref:AP-5 complex subunit mu-1 n=1 Tax=Ixodes scapularis TaxID=6945 RepID=UPI001C390752|nr:AP-5 complex subunit mu-1 [Ixodes scapularis]
MSLRAIAVISIPHKDAATTVYYRQFPTCEKRARLKHKQGYTPMPSHKALASALADVVCFDENEFKEWRDRVDVPLQLPAIEIRTLQGSLWPFVFTKEQGMYVCSMPLTDATYEPTERPELIDLPEVTSAFSAVMTVVKFLGPSLSNLTPTCTKLMELDNFLSVAAPFGFLQITEPSVVEAMLGDKEVVPLDETLKVPAWRPVAFKGKPSLSVSIKETVHATQCERPDMDPVVEITGEVRVRCELEGHGAEVTLLLVGAGDGGPKGWPPLPLEALSVHSCVQAASNLQLATPGGAAPREASRVRHPVYRLRFSPPLHPFSLCYYGTAPAPMPPIAGVYSMRGDKHVDFLIQLKLQEGIRNMFQSCEVRIPFFNRGKMKKSSLTPSCGSVSTAKDKFGLVWSIGHKFTQGSLEASLTGTASFEDNPPEGERNASPMLTGLTSYIQLQFRMVDCTLTGCQVDPKSIQISPPCKLKISLEREVESREYRIWNKFGELPFAIPKSCT